MAGGYTMPLPSKDPMYMTKKKMEQEIISLLGGRAAEKLVLDDITTGASNDIERASAIARNMVVKYGMSDVIGPIQFGSDNEEVFIGRDWGHTRNYGENIAGLIDSEIKRMVDSGYEEAKSILESHIDILHKTADLLMEKEKITGAQFRALFEAKKEGILDEVELDEASVERLLFGNKSEEEKEVETEA
jgi:cell division protease FtsH